MDRNLFINDGVIGLKDASRPFPMGQPLGVVKWRFQSKDENDVPLYGASAARVRGGRGARGRGR